MESDHEYVKTKSQNIFDWNDEEAYSALAEADSFSLSLESKRISKSKDHNRTNSTTLSVQTYDRNLKSKKKKKRDSETKSSEGSTSVISHQKNASDSFQRAILPLTDSFKNVFQNAKFDKLKALTNFTDKSTNSIGIHDFTSKPRYSTSTFDLPESATAVIIMQRIIDGKSHTFSQFQSLKDKHGLLQVALDTFNSSCIIKTCLFLQETLNQNYFQELMDKYPAASNEYIYFLKSLKLSNSLKIVNSQPTLNRFIYDFSCIIHSSITEMTICKLQKIYKKYSGYSQFRDYLDHITTYIEILKLQFGNKNSPNISNNLISLLSSEPSLIDAVKHFILDYIKTNDNIAFELKKIFKLNDIQFEYLMVIGCATAEKYKILHKFYGDKVVGTLFKNKTPISATSFSNICYLLHKLHAPQDIIINYLYYIPEVEVQLCVAENLKMYESCVLICTATRNKSKLIELSSKVILLNENLHRTIIETLSNPRIKWK